MTEALNKKINKTLLDYLTEPSERHNKFESGQAVLGIFPMIGILFLCTTVAVVGLNLVFDSKNGTPGVNPPTPPTLPGYPYIPTLFTPTLDYSKGFKELLSGPGTSTPKAGSSPITPTETPTIPPSPISEYFGTDPLNLKPGPLGNCEIMDGEGKGVEIETVGDSLAIATQICLGLKPQFPGLVVGKCAGDMQIKTDRLYIGSAGDYTYNILFDNATGRPISAEIVNKAIKEACGGGSGSVESVRKLANAHSPQDPLTRSYLDKMALNKLQNGGKRF